MAQISRKKTRKYLFQKLFSNTYNKNDSELFSESFLIENFKGNIDMPYLEEMEEIITTKEAYLLEVLKKFAPRFDPENMSLTYIIPIFIGASEMLFLKEEIPAKVSINEAVEISKAYGEDSAKKIVNGVLNKLMENYDEVKKDFENNEYKSDFSFFA